MSDSAPIIHQDVAGSDRSRLRMMLCGIGFLGIVVSLILSANVLQALQKTEIAQVQSRLADLVGNIETQFNVQLASLRSFRAYLDVSEGFSLEKYSDFINNLHASEHSSITYGWAPKRLVLPTLTETTPDQQSNSRVASYPVVLMVPEEKNRLLMHADLLTMPQVEDALFNSIEHNEVQISNPLRWQTTGSEKLVVMAFYPQYQKGTTSILVKQRQQNVLGVAFGIFDLEETISFAISTSSLDRFIRSNSIGIEILDRPVNGTSVSLFQTGDFPKFRAAEDQSFIHSTVIIERALELAQRTFQIRMAVNLYRLNRTPYVAAASVLLIGIMLTLLLSYYVYSRFNEQKRINALVAERTNALENSEQRFRDMA